MFQKLMYLYLIANVRPTLRSISSIIAVLLVSSIIAVLFVSSITKILDLSLVR